jgi:hypothetical protein
MKNRGWMFILGIVSALSIFSSIRIMALYYYHLQQVRGDYTLAMIMMDKANVFNLTSYITGGLHFSIFIVLLMIMLEK